MFHLHLLRVSVVLALMSAAAVSAAPQSADDLMKMSEQLDQLDRADLQQLLDEARHCTQARAFACADAKILKATKLANSAGDKALLTTARNGLAQERQTAAREEQLRIELANQRERERVAAERRLAQLEADQRAREQAENAPQVNYGAAILEGFNSAMAGKARIDAIHDQAMANLQAVYAERHRQEEAQRQAQQEAQNRRREQAVADARQEADRARQVAQQQQRASAQSYASSSSAAAPQVDTAQRQREDAAKQAQRARDQARDQELLALEQKQKDAAAAASKARKEQAEAARLAQREAEKAAKEQASLAYLQAVMRGTTLLARKCPGGEGKYYIVGKRPRISPEVEPCIDIEFRAHCPGSNAYTEGSGKNFIGIGTDCFTGDTYPIDPPGCPVEQVRVTVTKVTACVFGGK